MLTPDEWAAIEVGQKMLLIEEVEGLSRRAHAFVVTVTARTEKTIRVQRGEGFEEKPIRREGKSKRLRHITDADRAHWARNALVREGSEALAFLEANYRGAQDSHLRILVELAAEVKRAQLDRASGKG